MIGGLFLRTPRDWSNCLEAMITS